MAESSRVLVNITSVATAIVAVAIMMVAAGPWSYELARYGSIQTTLPWFVVSFVAFVGLVLIVLVRWFVLRAIR